MIELQVDRFLSSWKIDSNIFFLIRNLVTLGDVLPQELVAKALSNLIPSIVPRDRRYFSKRMKAFGRGLLFLLLLHESHRPFGEIVYPEVNMEKRGHPKFERVVGSQILW
jgi:hypothetical protein